MKTSSEATTKVKTNISNSFARRMELITTPNHKKKEPQSQGEVQKTPTTRRSMTKQQPMSQPSALSSSTTPSSAAAAEAAELPQSTTETATTTTTTTTTPNRLRPLAPKTPTSVKHRPDNNNRIITTTTTPSTRKNATPHQKQQPHYMTPTKSRLQLQSSSFQSSSFQSSSSVLCSSTAPLSQTSTTSTSTAAKRLYLIRHGESMGQVAKRLGMNRQRDERLRDAKLTPQGIWQAQQLEQTLSSLSLNNHHHHHHHDNNDNNDDNNDDTWNGHSSVPPKIDLVVSSPLTRAVHTAILGFPSYYNNNERSTTTTTTPTPKKRNDHSGGGGGGGKKILIHYDLAEIGSRVPENTPRPIKKVLADIDIINHQIKKEKKDDAGTTAISWSTTSSTSIVDYTSLQPDTWPTVLYDGTTNRQKALRRAMMYLYHDRPEQCIAVVCHYNVIRQILSVCESANHTNTNTNTTVRPQNAEPIVCELRSNGQVVMINTKEE